MPDLVVAGAHRVAGRLDRAAALAPVLQRGGDRRVGSAVAQHPFARRVRQDLALRVDDDRRRPAQRRSVGVLGQVVEQRSARQAQRPAEHRGDAAVGGEHRHRQDHDRLARDARRRDARDHRPVLAHRVLEVVAVGDVAMRVAHAVLVVDQDDRAVERDDEDAREQRRQDALALDELSEARRRRRGWPASAAGRRCASARCRPTRRCDTVAAIRRASSSCESRTICSLLRPTSRRTKITVSATLARISIAPASAMRTFNERRLNVCRAVRIHAFRYGRESFASCRGEMCEIDAPRAQNVTD